MSQNLTPGNQKTQKTVTLQIVFVNINFRTIPKFCQMFTKAKYAIITKKHQSA